MTTDQLDALPAPTQLSKYALAFAKSLLASLCALLGIVLLVAGKSTAGVAFIGAAVFVILPLTPIVKARRLAEWSRAAVVVVLIALATYSVANTDIVPEQAKTGYKFVDQVLAIFQRFQENLFGRSPPSRQ